MGEIVYNKESAFNAFKCLANMRELESTTNFGKLKGLYPKSNIYSIEENGEIIDSTVYTEKATAILGVAILQFEQDLSKFDNDVYDYFLKYKNDLINDPQVEQDLSKLDGDLYDYFLKYKSDLTNDSQGEYANFEMDKLYKYFSEFEILSNDEKKELLPEYVQTQILDLSNLVALKKSENINGTEIDFYYLGKATTLHKTVSQTDKHASNVKFLKEKIPGNVMSALKSKAEFSKIITLTNNCLASNSNPYWAAYSSVYEGYIVVRDDYFEDSICHEMGHTFDYMNKGDFLTFDYEYTFNKFGIWDQIALKYSDEIATIRRGAGIGCGYGSDDLLKKHEEFYADAFQLYFYSPETRAALPEKVRKTLEREFKRYSGN